MRIILSTITLAGAFMLAGAVTPVSAQTADTPVAAIEPGIVELGGNLAGLFVGASMAPLAGPQITLNFTSRHALQLRADLTGNGTDHSWEVYGPYSVLYRYTFMDHPNVRAYIVAGGGGAIGGSHHDESTYTTPEHTYTVNGQPKTVAAVTTHHDAATNWDMTIPVAAVVGVGSDTRLARRLTMQFQGELAITPYFIGARASFGMSVALGRVPR